MVPRKPYAALYPSRMISPIRGNRTGIRVQVPPRTLSKDSSACCSSEELTPQVICELKAKVLVDLGLVVRVGVGCVFLLGMTCRLCRVHCPDIRSVRVFRSYLALPIVIFAGQRLRRQVSGGASGTA